MGHVFRQKLLNWFISVMFLLSAMAIVMVIFWFFRAPSITAFYEASGLASIAGHAGELFLIYVILFPPILIWHLVDFATREIETGRVARLFGSHRTLLVTMGASQLGFILAITGLFSWDSCDDIPLGALPYACRVGIDWWVMSLIFGPLLFSLILCIGKAVIAVRSRLLKAA